MTFCRHQPQGSNSKHNNIVTELGRVYPRSSIHCSPPLCILPCFSDQLITVGIMLGVPSLKISLLHPNELMSYSAVILVHYALLTNGVASPLRDKVDPEIVVNSASQDARKC